MMQGGTDALTDDPQPLTNGPDSLPARATGFADYALLCMEVMTVGAVFSAACAALWASIQMALTVQPGIPVAEKLWMSPLFFGWAFLLMTCAGLIAALIALPGALLVGWPVWRRLSDRSDGFRTRATTTAWGLGSIALFCLPALVVRDISGFLPVVGTMAALAALPGILFAGWLAPRLWRASRTGSAVPQDPWPLSGGGL